MFTSPRPAHHSALLPALLPALLLLAAPSVSAEPAPARDEGGAQGTAHVALEAPDIALVGASVSAGFRLADYAGLVSNLRGKAERMLGRELSDDEYGRRTDSVQPGDVLAAVCGREVASFGDPMLFGDPEPRGRVVLEAGLASGAELVVGVDLMFWFGYGRTEAGAEFDPAEQRFALQAKGLALVEELLASHPDTTLVLGDYPDLSGALPVMITPEMIPSAEVRAELNRRLFAWADERPKVSIFPLSAALERLRDGEATLVVDGETRPVDLDAAFQLAQVHPTRLGTALLVRDLVAFLALHADAGLQPRDATDSHYLAAAGVTW